MMQNTAGPLAYWIDQGEQAGICPALASLTIDMVGPDFRGVENALKSSSGSGCMQVFRKQLYRLRVARIKIQIHDYPSS